MEECDELEDPFNQHFHYDLSPELLSAVSRKEWENIKNSWPCLQQIVTKLPRIKESGNEIAKTIDDTITYAKPPYPPKNAQTANLKHFHIKSQIAGNVSSSNLTYTGENNLSLLQLELLSIISEYKDLYYTERTFTNADQIRFVYSLHVINHILKTRLKITHHNARISDKSEISDEFRDQGLVRPKALIVLPFKNSAFK